MSNNTRAQKYKENLDVKDLGRRREISEITCKHLEQVFSMMIPSSTCSSMDPIEIASANSMVTQPNNRDIEESECKYIVKEREKQVIVNNYYISDKESRWKQLKKGEIPPNISRNSTQRTLSKISPNKTLMEHSSRQLKRHWRK